MIFLKDKEVHRNNCVLGVVERVFESKNNKVRKVKSGCFRMLDLKHLYVLFQSSSCSYLENSNVEYSQSFSDL